MSIIETIYKHRKHRVCVGNNGVQKIWNRYSFWTHASDVEFDDGSTLEERISSIKGATNDINAEAGYAADISLVRSIRDTLKNLIDGLSNVVNGINNRLGGLTFYEDSNGKWVVGADSVPKKLDSGKKQSEWMVVGEEWFGDNSGVPGQHSGSQGNFVGKYGGYILEHGVNSHRYVLAKDYDIKELRADYAHLTEGDFVCIVTSFLYANVNDGWDDGGREDMDGPSVHTYNPETGTLTVKAGYLFDSGPNHGYCCAVQVKTMIYI